MDAPLPNTPPLALTDDQCNEFRRLPVRFNDMVRAIYATGYTAGFSAHAQTIEDLMHHLRLFCSGTVELLCDCSTRLGNAPDANDLRDSIEQAATDWCALTGWSIHRILDRIEVVPPANRSL